MKRLSTRLTFSLTLVILFVLVSLALLLGQIIKTYHVNYMNEQLKNESQFISMYIEENGGISSLTNKKISEISDMFGFDMTFMSTSGEIMKDSGWFSNLSEQVRKNIMDEIMFNDQSISTLPINEQEDHIHYYRTPFFHDGKIEGYLVLSTSEDELNTVYSKLWWLLAISFFLAFFVIVLIGSSIMRRMTKSIDSATRVITQLSKGNFRARIDDFQKDDVSSLNQSVSLLANNLHELVKKQEMQQDRLSTLVENMGSGLILIDGYGFISLVNRTYKELFHIETDDYLNKPYYKVIEAREVSDLVEEVFMTEQKVRRQLLLPLRIERRHFEVYGAPIIGENNAWKGIILVFHDITELKKLEKTRKDFVANVSHELKTPITSIKGFTETLLDGAMKDNEALQSFLLIILKESDRLQVLIQDLLELSKIEQEGFTLNRQYFNLYDILNEITTLLNGRALEKNISLTFTSNEEQVTLFADIDRIKQVFINLINNAISYTYENGSVKMELINTNKEIIIEVSDTGIGMDKDQIPRIFERFYRIDKARSRNSGGTGLGLAIVKHIVEAHEGEIIVHSTIGKGTTFIVKLPK